PEFDPIGIAQFINHGYYLGERTPFADIRCLEPDSALELVADDFRIRRLSGTCGIQRFSLSSRRAREISEVLVSSAAAMRDRSINLGLTGGKDSRLMAAILSKAGVPFKSSTVGEPSDPHVI